MFSSHAVSESWVLQALRTGDEKAFEELVLAYQDRVYDFCLRMLGDRAEAEDGAQEVFLRVHQTLKTFREDSSLTTWIYRIAKNQCLNKLRYLNRRGRGRVDDVEQVPEAALSSATPDNAPQDARLMTEHTRAAVQAAIAALPAEMRLLVILRDIEGLSYDEVASVTELAEGTVKSRLHRARERLAKVLGGLER